MKTLNVVVRLLLGVLLSALLSACGGGSSGEYISNAPAPVADYSVIASAGIGGTISPATQTVLTGDSASPLTITAASGYAIKNVTGCDGKLSGNIYTIDAVNYDCSVTTTFYRLTFSVAAQVGPGGGTISPHGRITPATQTIPAGDTTTLTVNPDTGFEIDTVVSDCGGSLAGNTYTTVALTDAGCSVSATFKLDAPTPTLSFAPVKLLHFEWTNNPAVTHYQLLENPDGNSGFTQVGDNIAPGVEVFDHQVPLYARVNAEYILRSCDATGCESSDTVFVSGTLVDSIGYVKASDTNAGDVFGSWVSLNSARHPGGGRLLDNRRRRGVCLCPQ